MLYSVAIFSLVLLLGYFQVLLPIMEMKKIRSRERFNASYRAFKAVSVKRFHPEFKSQSLFEIFDDASLDTAFNSLDIIRTNESGQKIWWPLKSEMDD